MSWSISTVLKSEGALLSTNAFEELMAVDRAGIGNENCLVERDEQIETTIRVVSKLLGTNTFKDAKEVSVLMSGHANPNHEIVPDAGMNESITLSLSVRK